MGNKIKTNHTIEEYNKKYGNKNLTKVLKIDVDKNKTLLENKSWWLIKDTYYEVPNNKISIWWNNLGKGGKVAICVLAGAAVATAVIVPTVVSLTKKEEKGTTIEVVVPQDGWAEQKFLNPGDYPSSIKSTDTTFTYKLKEPSIEDSPVGILLLNQEGLDIEGSFYNFKISEKEHTVTGIDFSKISKVTVWITAGQ